MPAVWVTNYVPETPPGCRNCGTCGAVVPASNSTMHDIFHDTWSNRVGADMSNVAWCDYGNHAFKKGEEGSSSFQGTEVVDGITTTVNMDACTDHNPLNIQRQANRLQISPEHYKDLTNDTGNAN